MTEPKPDYSIKISGQEELIPLLAMPTPEQIERINAAHVDLLLMVEERGFVDQGHQWAGQGEGHVHLFENAEGRVVQVTPQETVEVWRE